MQKKSALTAALSGAQQPAPAPAATVAAPLANPNEDHYAFPCLLHAHDDGLATVEEGIEAMDLGHVTVVGSAPTNVLLPNGTPLVGSCNRSCIMAMAPADPHCATLHAGGLPPGPLQAAWWQGDADRTACFSGKQQRLGGRIALRPRGSGHPTVLLTCQQVRLGSRGPAAACSVQWKGRGDDDGQQHQAGTRQSWQ
jgi:hypothetical protein